MVVTAILLPERGNGVWHRWLRIPGGADYPENDALPADVLDALEIKFGADARAEFASLLEEVRDSNRLAALDHLALRAKDMNGIPRSI